MLQSSNGPMYNSWVAYNSHRCSPPFYIYFPDHASHNKGIFWSQHAKKKFNIVQYLTYLQKNNTHRVHNMHGRKKKQKISRENTRALKKHGKNTWEWRRGRAQRRVKWKCVYFFVFTALVCAGCTHNRTNCEGVLLLLPKKMGRRERKNAN